MKLQMMAVYDEKARAFILPFQVPHVDVGLRMIQQASLTPDHQFNRYPEDFTVYHLGEWDDNTAHLEQFPQPKNLGKVLVLQVAGSMARPAQQQPQPEGSN